MRVGYARVSTGEQGIESQIARLSDCERVFSETFSGARQDRRALAECLSFVREGDALVVTRLDRLARSVSHLCEIAAQLEGKRVALVVLDQAIDTSTPTGRLLFHVLAAIAEFELGIRKEQQRSGIAQARAAGKKLGRSPRLNKADQDKLRLEWGTGTPIYKLARKYDIGIATVYRYLHAAVSNEDTFREEGDSERNGVDPAR